MSEKLPDEALTFDSPRDQVLWDMMQHEWAVQSSGEIDAPTGSFAWMSNTEDELTEIVDAFTDAFNDAGLDNCSPLLGNFVIIDRGRGPIEVTSFETEDEARLTYDGLNVEYRRWCEDGV